MRSKSNTSTNGASWMPGCCEAVRLRKFIWPVSARAGRKSFDA